MTSDAPAPDRDAAPVPLAGSALSASTLGAGRLRRAGGAPLDAGATVGGRYRIDAFVAEGAFGAVYRATDLDVAGHVVALKLMHRPAASEEERARALREAQLIAAVSHPSVVSFKDHGLHRGRFFIVMPWYEGETLAQRLHSRGPIKSRREALRIFRQLAEALSAMHERGVYHRDVKPENILLATLGGGQPELPVLLDLGVSGEGADALLGFTVAYVAPEMARAHCADEGLGAQGQRAALDGLGAVGAVDGQADVYALCLTLFDALSSERRVFPPETAIAFALRQRARGGLELPDVVELADVLPSLRAWLADDPALRPTAVELVQKLAVLTRREERHAERRRVLKRLVPVALIMTVFMAALGHAWFRERSKSHTKDRQIERQAQAIGEAREALDLLSHGPVRAEDLVDLKRQNRELELTLRDEREQRAQHERDLMRDVARAESYRSKAESAEERVVLLERELTRVEERIGRVEQERSDRDRDLAKLNREYELMVNAQKREKADLASLVRRLVEERDGLSERLSALTRDRAQLVGRLSPAHTDAPPVAIE